MGYSVFPPRRDYGTPYEGSSSTVSVESLPVEGRERKYPDQDNRKKNHEDKISDADERNVGLNPGMPNNPEPEPHRESDGSQARTPDRM